MQNFVREIQTQHSTIGTKKANLRGIDAKCCAWNSDTTFSGCLLEQLLFDNALSWWCWYVLLSYDGLYYFNATWRVLCKLTRKCLFPLDTYQWRLVIRSGLGASSRREIGSSKGTCWSSRTTFSGWGQVTFWPLFWMAFCLKRPSQTYPSKETFWAPSITQSSLRKTSLRLIFRQLVWLVFPRYRSFVQKSQTEFLMSSPKSIRVVICFMKTNFHKTNNYPNGLN